MRRINFTLLFASFFMVTVSHSQISKGSTLLGGTLGFNTYKTLTSDNKETNLSFSPVFGKAVSDNTVLGGSLRFAMYEINGSKTSSSYGAGIFLRKYRPLGKGFYLFGESNLKFDYGTYKENFGINQIEEYKTKTYTVSIGLNPGLSYEITKRLQLELVFPDLISANYNWGKREGIGNATFYNRKTNGFGVNSNLSLNGISSVGIGIRFLLNNRDKV